jgi:feruloyl esterase
VSYYENVVRTMGADRVRDSVRLFMVPGMHHCFGGVFPGAYQVDFDPVQAVRAWKATGRAPDQIVVTTSGQGWPMRKRLVCAYPNVSGYKGSGDTADPSNFACAAP